MSNDYEREDMLSILRKYRPVYFAVFITRVTAWCIGVSWRESTLGGHTTDTLGMIIAIGTKMAPLTGLSVITTVVLVEIGRYLMVLFLPTPNVRRRIEKAQAKGHAEGHAEGKAQERRNWVAWNRRRKKAEAEGLPFDEPPPGE